MNLGCCIHCGKSITEIVDSGCGVCGTKPKKMVNLQKVLKKAADDLFSISIRAECDWRCVKCRQRFNPAAKLDYMTDGSEVLRRKSWGDSGKLHASHYHKRAKYNTRWLRSNVWSQCGGMRPGGGGRWVMTGCHAESEVEGTEGRKWYKKFIIGKIGESRFREMEIRANVESTGHDLEMIILDNFLLLERMGYSMEWFVKSHQRHMKFNLRLATNNIGEAL